MTRVIVLLMLLAGKVGAYPVTFETASARVKTPQPESIDKTILGAPFTNHAVFQRGKPIRIWGWDNPTQKISLSLDGKNLEVTPNDQGYWRAEFPAMDEGGPFALKIKGSSQHILEDVLIGDVWLATGQSNMQWPVAWSDEADTFIPKAEDNQLRFLSIPFNPETEPVPTVKTNGWQTCTSQTVISFSAIGYYFARMKRLEENVPVGVINASWGGATIESYIDAQSFESNESISDNMEVLHQWVENRNDEGSIQKFERDYETWRELAGEDSMHDDPGNTGEENDWHLPGFDDSDWKVMKLPVHWEYTEVGDLDGVIWFRKEVELPHAYQNRQLKLSLGAVDDTDITYFNGERVGQVDTSLPEFWTIKRVYTIDQETNSQAKASIAVRVFDRYLGGGFTGPEELMRIEVPDGSLPPISISGEWKYKPSTPLIQMPSRPGANGHQIPTALFNGMLNPVMPFSLDGILWYQGEANCANWKEYGLLQNVMLKSWREHFEQHELPFLYVQLAGFDVDWTGWNEVRQKQLELLSQPYTAMSTASDLGDPGDIHPKRKREVAERLYALEKRNAYGARIGTNCPVPTDFEIDENICTITIANSGGGLKVHSGEAEVTLIDSSGGSITVFPKLEVDRIHLELPDNIEVTEIRYGWDQYPTLEIYNSRGLPLIPFQLNLDKGVSWVRE